MKLKNIVMKLIDFKISILMKLKNILMSGGSSREL
jgi:hypothetical protein